MINNDIDETGLKIYKKIFVSNLKKIGIYNAVIKGYFHKNNISFGYYITNIKGLENITFGSVSTLLGPVQNITHNDVKASLFLILVLTDRRFYFLFPKYTKIEEIRNEISQTIAKEIAYIETLSEGDWKKLDLSDALIMAEAIENYENGKYLWRTIKDKLNTIEGFENEYRFKEQQYT